MTPNVSIVTNVTKNGTTYGFFIFFLENKKYELIFFCSQFSFQKLFFVMEKFENGNSAEVCEGFVRRRKILIFTISPQKLTFRLFGSNKIYQNWQ